MEEFSKLIERHSKLKFELRDIEHQMVDYVMRWEGTLAQAIGAGLVRLNFPAPTELKDI